MSFISENFGDYIDDRNDEAKWDYQQERIFDDEYYRHPDIDKGSGICPLCNGSGEGQNENQKCGQCKGHGII